MWLQRVLRTHSTDCLSSCSVMCSSPFFPPFPSIAPALLRQASYGTLKIGLYHYFKRLNPGGAGHVMGFAYVWLRMSALLSQMKLC